jgi:hypothetical protein
LYTSTSIYQKGSGERICWSRKDNLEWIIQRHKQRWAQDIESRQTKRKHTTQKTKKMSNRDLTKNTRDVLLWSDLLWHFLSFYDLNVNDAFSASLIWTSVIFSEFLWSELLGYFLRFYDLNFCDTFWASMIWASVMLSELPWSELQWYILNLSDIFGTFIKQFIFSSITFHFFDDIG